MSFVLRKMDYRVFPVIVFLLLNVSENNIVNHN